MYYSDIVSNAKRLDKTIFDLTDEDFNDSKLILANNLIVLGNNKGARCLINKDGTTILNKQAEKEVERWLNKVSVEETNWLCPVEKICKAFNVIVVDYR